MSKGKKKPSRKTLQALNDSAMAIIRTWVPREKRPNPEWLRAKAVRVVRRGRQVRVEILR